MDQQQIARGQEKSFFELFYRALMMLKAEFRVSDEDIVNGIIKSIDLFRGGPNGACLAIHFQTYGDQLGNFYWSSPLSAGVTRKEVLSTLQSCEEFRYYFSQPSLKIVSLGGGTGSDLVGLYSAVYEYFIAEQQQSIDRSMEVLIVDNNIVWEPFFRKVDELLRAPVADFGSASQLMRRRNITTSFLEADLNLLADDLRQKLSNANIVWMKSILGIQNNDDDRDNIVENVISSMTPGALLVVLESPYYLNNFVEKTEGLERIFQTDGALPYELKLLPELEIEFRHCERTNKKLRIYKKMNQE